MWFGYGPLQITLTSPPNQPLTDTTPALNVSTDETARIQLRADTWASNYTCATSGTSCYYSNLTGDYPTFKSFNLNTSSNVTMPSFIQLYLPNISVVGAYGNVTEQVQNSSNLTDAIGEWGGNFRRYLGQGIKFNSTPLTRVFFRSGGSTAGNTTRFVTLHLVADLNGFPNTVAAPLASSTPFNLTVGTEFYVGLHYAVTPGTQYHLLWNMTNSCGTTCYGSIDGQGSNVYAWGNSSYWDGAAWVYYDPAGTGQDRRFVTYTLGNTTNVSIISGAKTISCNVTVQDGHIFNIWSNNTARNNGKDNTSLCNFTYSLSDLITSGAQIQTKVGAGSLGASSLQMDYGTTNFAQGQHWIDVFARDSAGNENATRGYFTLQLLIDVWSPINTTYYDKTPIWLNVSSNDPAATWWYQYNANGTNITFTPNVTFISGGGYAAKKIQIWVNNSGGLSNTTTIFFSTQYFLNFSITTLQTVEAYKGFTVRLHVNTTQPVTFGLPTIYFFNGTALWGSWVAEYYSGSENDVWWVRTLNLPAGNYTYFANVTDSAGTVHTTPTRYVYVYSPFVPIPTGIMVVVWRDPTPHSNDAVDRTKTTIMVAEVLNVNSGLAYSLLQVYDLNYNLLSNTTMAVTESGVNNWMARVALPIPSDKDSIFVRMCAGDNMGYAVCSVELLYLVTETAEPGGLGSLDIFSQLIPTKHGSLPDNAGKYLGGLILLLLMMITPLRYGTGISSSITIGTITAITEVRYGYLPAWVGVLILFGIAYLAAKLVGEMIGGK